MNQKLRKEYCGILGYRPQWIQRFASVQFFTFFACIIVAIQGIYLGYFIGIITTIEKRFKLDSKSSGGLLSFYDIGHAISVLLVGHYGFWFHKAKWIGIGGYLSCLACFGLALPHVIFGAFDRTELSLLQEQNQSTSYDGMLCIPNMTNISSTLNSSHVASANDKYSNDNRIAYYILVCFQILCGLASSPFTTLTFVYIDDNAPQKKSPFYLGLFNLYFKYLSNF